MQRALGVIDDAAMEKPRPMESFGATVERVRPVSITHKDHFVNVARRRAEELCESNGRGAGYFADQFENTANPPRAPRGNGSGDLATAGAAARRRRTAPVVSTSGRRLDAFICACGTGGTPRGDREVPQIEGRRHRVPPGGSAGELPVQQGEERGPCQPGGGRGQAAQELHSTRSPRASVNNRLTCNFRHRHRRRRHAGWEDGRQRRTELAVGAFCVATARAVERK